jgi:hypothetical protein
MWFAVCDPSSSVSAVYLNDNGDGTCAGAYVVEPLSDFTIPNRVSFNCTTVYNLFGGQTCKTYNGTISLQTQNTYNLGSVAYKAPDFQKWLTNVGLGSLVTAGMCTFPYSLDVITIVNTLYLLNRKSTSADLCRCMCTFSSALQCMPCKFRILHTHCA